MCSQIDFTFGIITNGSSDNFLCQIIDSIKIQNIPNYEIIIVGNTNIKQEDDTVIIIPFDETIKPAWITRKKNIIAQKAKYPYIVFLHDYIMFMDGWYDGFLKFKQLNEDFDVISNVIINYNNTRFRDWAIFPEFLKGNYGVTPHKNADKIINHGCLLPYDFQSNKDLNKYIYYSGGYFIVKKSFILEHPLDEKLSWGQGEDVLWCCETGKNTIFKFNKYSNVKLMKQKPCPYWQKELKDINLFVH